MRDLFKALYDYFHADPMSDELTEIYNTLADANAVFPYVVFSLVSDVPDWTFSEDFEDVLLQFDIYCDQSSSNNICDLFELLKGTTKGVTGFDFCSLPIDNHTTISFIREPASLNRWEIGGKLVWNYNVTYSILLQKT